MLKMNPVLKCHGMKASDGSDLQFQAFLTSVLNGGV
jgi:hypothetical protein